ncbi:MAG: hypothetical protein KTR19_01985, partial [Hyphomicrobiales bacterium]|nr:hypothetical protein [Hyphomicrobiales bacterium]
MATDDHDETTPSPYDSHRSLMAAIDNVTADTDTENVRMRARDAWRIPPEPAPTLNRRQRQAYENPLPSFFGEEPKTESRPKPKPGITAEPSYNAAPAAVEELTVSHHINGLLRILRNKVSRQIAVGAPVVSVQVKNRAKTLAGVITTKTRNIGHKARETLATHMPYFWFEKQPTHEVEQADSYGDFSYFEEMN